MTPPPDAAAEATVPWRAMDGTRRPTWRRLCLGNDVSRNALSLVVLVLTWQVVSGILASPFVPGPVAVGRAFATLAVHGDYEHIPLWRHCAASLERLVVGFAAGALVGVPLGLLMGLMPGLARGTRAAIEPFRFIPPIAWIPLAIILLSGMERYAFVIFLGAFFPIYTASALGVARVEMRHRDVAKIHGASKAWIVIHVVIPSALPEIISGMRVGLGVARMMINYAEILQVAPIVVGMILIGAFGLLGNELLLLLEKRLFRWRWAVTL
jgi:ABC-type nitrate/sulfonate/bicarbonate transport system permease component